MVADYWEWTYNWSKTGLGERYKISQFLYLVETIYNIKRPVKSDDIKRQ